MSNLPKCSDCGRFCRPAAWKMLYSGSPPTPDEEIYKCAECLKTNGEYKPQDGIKPESSCGIMKGGA